VRTKPYAFIALAIALVAALAATAYWLNGRPEAPALPPHPPAASIEPIPSTPKDGERRVLYWHDPMVPGPRFDKPGKSPFMDMELVPVYANEVDKDGGVRIIPGVQQSLGIRTAEVRKGSLAAPLQVAGSVAYNERDTALVTARNSGYVEKLHVRATLQSVRRGEALAQVYVPEWVAAQEEYLSARRLDDGRFEGLTEAARQRMALTGMPETVIRQVESTGSVHARVTLYAPIEGVVTELSVREGATLSIGMPLFRINGMRTVWVDAEVPESAARRVRPGLPAKAHSAAYPDQTFAGKVSALLPQVNATTRTLKARLELLNPGARLAPGMFVTVRFEPLQRGEYLIVPSEALIRTGTRTVVFVTEDEGRFAPVEVMTGAEANGETEVRAGLEEGQRVVVSGQFLVDSEASLRGTETRMDAEESEKAGDASATPSERRP